MNKIGIIGCGRQAPKHINGYLGNGIKDIYLSDVDVDKAKKLAMEYGLKHLSYDEIINSKEITAYSICTPPKTHDLIIDNLIEKGKNFLCEKPISLNIDKLHKHEKSITKKKLVAMGGYIYKFSPAHIHAKKLIENADSNTIQKAYFRIASPGSNAPWQFSKKLGGGVINEMVVHIIDLVQWYFGDIKEIKNVSKKIYLEHRIKTLNDTDELAEDYVHIKLVTKSNVEVEIEADLISSEFIQYVQFNSDEFECFLSIQPNLPLQLKYQDKSMDLCKFFEFQNLYIDQIEYFLQCVNKNKTQEISTMKESIAIARTINEIIDL